MSALLRLFQDPQHVILVPVPLHPSRLKERGYNQAEHLAKWVARQCGARFATPLRRSRLTAPQARLARKDRLLNMQGAFEVHEPLARGSPIILVDDVITTGATLLACRNALRSAGASEIAALTLADRP
jgi:ComF family protein